MKYPAVFKKSGKGYVVTFRDIPEAITQGKDYKEAADMALDALLTAFEFYVENKDLIPPPSKPREGEVLITLSISHTAKVLLLNAMMQQRVTQSKLARIMGVSPQHITRLVDIKHGTKIDTIEKAFNAIGFNLEITVSDSEYN